MVVSSNTDNFKKHKLPLNSLVSSSDNYIIVNICSRNMTGEATPVCIKKMNLEVPIGLSF